MSVYAVKNGRKTGVFRSWSETEPLIKGFAGAKFKKFDNLTDAEEYLNSLEIITPQSNQTTNGLNLFIAGFFEPLERIYAYSFVAFDSNDNTLKEHCGIIDGNDDREGPNMVSEVQAAIEGLAYARGHQYQAVNVFYRYDGVYRWAIGDWKAKQPIAIKYCAELAKYNDMTIRFQKAESPEELEKEAHAIVVVQEITEELIRKKRHAIIEHDKEVLKRFNLSNIDHKEKSIIDNVIFITGNAGTGKTTLIRALQSEMKNLVVLAPTGLAAINVLGQTIHSYFNFPIEYFDINEINIKWVFSHGLHRLFYLTTLVIDETSMVRVDLMDKIDKVLRVAKNKDIPFGGVYLILVGDLFQLPPVINYSRDNEMVYHLGDESADNQQFKLLADYIENKYGGFYFFNAPVFKNNHLRIIELTEVYRQEDPTFVEILGKIREGNVIEKDLEVFFPCVGPSRLNAKAITIAPHRAKVTEINQFELDKIKTHESSFLAQKIQLDEEPFPVDLPNEEMIILKPGAKVMLLTNDINHRYFNGSIGEITKIVENNRVFLANGVELKDASLEPGVYVSIDSNQDFLVEANKWTYFKYQYDRETKTIKPIPFAEYIQIPIALAWAITIHKSQGLTLENVNINLDISPFADGQTYVALSRCRNLEGIQLSRRLRLSDIKISKEVIEYIKQSKKSGNYYLKIGSKFVRYYDDQL